MDHGEQQAFGQMKFLMATDALLAYLDHSNPFQVETDTSDYQLGAVIKQDGCPITFYFRKLNPMQQNYTMIEKNFHQSLKHAVNFIQCSLTQMLQFTLITGISPMPLQNFALSAFSIGICS